MRGVQLGPEGGAGHAARSQIKYSSAFSCVLIGDAVHSVGNGSPVVSPSEADDTLTCMSL